MRNLFTGLWKLEIVFPKNIISAKFCHLHPSASTILVCQFCIDLSAHISYVVPISILIFDIGNLFSIVRFFEAITGVSIVLPTSS